MFQNFVVALFELINRVVGVLMLGRIRRQILHKAIIVEHRIGNYWHHVNREPIVNRGYQNRLVVQIAWHLSIVCQILLSQFHLLFYRSNRLAPSFLRVSGIHIEGEQNVFAPFTHPACFMVRVNDAFSPHVVTEVWLHTFFALLNLFMSHWFYLVPLVGEVLAVVNRILSFIQGLIFGGFWLFLLIREKRTPYSLLNHELHHAIGLRSLSRLHHKIVRENKLRVV